MTQPTITRGTEHHVDYGREPADFFTTTAGELTFREPRTLTADLARLEQHYRDEAARLRAEARDATEAARECRAWRANVRLQRAGDDLSPETPDPETTR